MTPAQQKILTFGKWLLWEGIPEGGSPINPNKVRQAMKDCGILHEVTVQGRCGDECICADWGPFPQSCFKVTPDVLDELNHDQ